MQSNTMFEWKFPQIMLLTCAHQHAHFRFDWRWRKMLRFDPFHTFHLSNWSLFRTTSEWVSFFGSFSLFVRYLTHTESIGLMAREESDAMQIKIHWIANDSEKEKKKSSLETLDTYPPWCRRDEKCMEINSNCNFVRQKRASERDSTTCFCHEFEKQQ